MRVSAFSKTYGRRTVLELPELELPDGKITAVLGPNGSGKSTLARVLAGIEPSDRKLLPAGSVKVGYMPQKSFAFRMSTEKNIMLNGGNSERRAELIRALRLESVARNRAGKLSGGETAKMALARLLMGSYGLLILDEPTSAMDMEATLAAEKLIREYACGGGTVLLITHSIQQARRIAEYAVFLYNGELWEQGMAERILSKPEKQETRQFLDFYGVR